VTFEQRFALVLMAAFFLSSIATSLAALVFASPILRARVPGGPSRRAGALALYRLMPALASIAATLLVLGPGYFRHEQRAELEGAGYGLLALACGGLIVLLLSAVRLLGSMRQTSALRRAWLAEARPIDLPASGMPAFALDLPFPLVAVLGVLRPRLFISEAVLRECPKHELDAILEHERAHVLGRDNAIRLLMDAAPDLLGGTRVPAAVAGAWRQAVEHRADDAATRRLDLASALVRVARVASASPRMQVPVSALYGGEGTDVIAERVRRLVGPQPQDARGRGLTAVAGSALALGALLSAAAVSGAASRAAHVILEAAVSRLP